MGKLLYKQSEVEKAKTKNTEYKGLKYSEKIKVPAPWLVILEMAFKNKKYYQQKCIKFDGDGWDDITGGNYCCAKMISKCQ